ncbi:MAG: Hsp20/alpha crystallin family protein [Chloroflexi bacterium]|nr:Hsp20/alpha crystallin family protein [Chloroflexota bacterium]
MSLLYYDPIRRMQRLMSLLGSMWPEEPVTDARQTAALSVPLDVYAEEDGYTIVAWVPGLDVDNIHIEVVDDTVTIEGEFPAPEEDEKRQILLKEIPVGRFKRVITLPTTLEASEAEAELTNGVLVLRIPKAEALRPKTIKIKTKK